MPKMHYFSNNFSKMTKSNFKKTAMMSF